MIERCEQTKSNACKAALAEYLHENSICPGNHHLYYQNGWFQMDDGKPWQEPKLTQRAEELLKINKETGKDTVLFSTVWNTYVVNK